MDRQIVWPGAIPLETDILNAGRDMMVGLGSLASALFGSTVSANGLAVSPTAPASMAVLVGPGEVYSVENVDDTAFSSLAADTAHQTVKQGISNTAITLACPAPTSAGQSINYLIEATFTETDSNPVVLPYYNSSDPTTAYSGPANSGAAQPTARKGTVTLTAKPGIAAASGSQTTPTVDAGYIALAVVTVAYGATTISGSNIAAVASSAIVPVGGILAAIQGAVSYFARLQTAASAQAYADNTTPGSYTLTVPAWATRAEVQIVGGGGGGGGTATGYSGGGGGAGAIVSGVVNVAPGATLTAVVGGGGNGSSGTTIGGTGGTSSLTGAGSATGGFGGVGNTTAPAGGGGGTASSSSGLRVFVGGEGGDGSPVNASAPGGNGAAGPFGGQGRTGAGGGQAGVAPGAGGGGAWNGSGAGGAGAPGAVLVRWLA